MTQLRSQKISTDLIKGYVLLVFCECFPFPIFNLRCTHYVFVFFFVSLADLWYLSIDIFKIFFQPHFSIYTYWFDYGALSMILLFYGTPGKLFHSSY